MKKTSGRGDRRHLRYENGLAQKRRISHPLVASIISKSSDEYAFKHAQRWQMIAYTAGSRLSLVASVCSCLRRSESKQAISAAYGLCDVSSVVPSW